MTFKSLRTIWLRLQEASSGTPTDAKGVAQVLKQSCEELNREHEKIVKAESNRKNLKITAEIA